MREVVCRECEVCGGRIATVEDHYSGECLWYLKQERDEAREVARLLYADIRLDDNWRSESYHDGYEDQPDWLRRKAAILALIDEER